MDQVLVRVKRLRKNPFKKLLSDTKLYRMRRPRPIGISLACGDFGACGSRFRPRERSE